MSDRHRVEADWRYWAGGARMSEPRQALSFDCIPDGSREAEVKPEHDPRSSTTSFTDVRVEDVRKHDPREGHARLRRPY